MGYRNVKGVWLKPIGFMVFSVKDNEISLFFTGKNGKTFCWDRKFIRPDNVLDIQSFECYSRTDMTGAGKGWEFLTLEQQMEDFL